MMLGPVPSSILMPTFTLCNGTDIAPAFRDLVANKTCERGCLVLVSYAQGFF